MVLWSEYQVLTIVHKKTQFSHSTNISFRRTGVLGDVLLFPCRADIISSCNLIKSVYLFFFVVTKRHKFASKNILIQFLSILSHPKGAYVPKGYFPSSPISSCRFGGLPTCQTICVPFFHHSFLQIVSTLSYLLSGCIPDATLYLEFFFL